MRWPTACNSSGSRWLRTNHTYMAALSYNERPSLCSWPLVSTKQIAGVVECLDLCPGNNEPYSLFYIHIQIFYISIHGTTVYSCIQSSHISLGILCIEYINIIWPFSDTVIIHHSTINLVCIFAEKTLYDFPQQFNNTYLKKRVDLIRSQSGFNTLKVRNAQYLDMINDLKAPTKMSVFKPLKKLYHVHLQKV